MRALVALVVWSCRAERGESTPLYGHDCDYGLSSARVVCSQQVCANDKTLSVSKIYGWRSAPADFNVKCAHSAQRSNIPEDGVAAAIPELSLSEFGH